VHVHEKGVTSISAPAPLFWLSGKSYINKKKVHHSDAQQIHVNSGQHLTGIFFDREMLPVTLLTISYQINCMFPIEDVHHIIANRLPKLKVKRIGFGDIAGYDSIVGISTQQPRYAFSCIESNRIHYFLHDGDRFRLCVWDHHNVSFDDKVAIVRNMVQWVQKETGGIHLEHLLFDYEDGVVFTDVLTEAKKDDTFTVEGDSAC
jgi:hypothetical protein